MTTGTYHNYGGTFAFPSGTYYPCQVKDYPDFQAPAINITNDGSGGYSEFIPAPLITLSPFTVMVLGRQGTYAALKAHEVSKTVGCVVVSDTFETLVGEGMVTNVKKEPADQKTPDAVKISVTIQPTAGWNISNV